MHIPSNCSDEPSIVAWKRVHSVLSHQKLDFLVHVLVVDLVTLVENHTKSGLERLLVVAGPSVDREQSFSRDDAGRWQGR